jgi:DNA-binding GntR family transcriptional regulator
VPKSPPSKSRSRVERSRLSQTVLSRLSTAIIGGEFEPGTRISEPTLSAMLGVSRAPIREALIELELRGLVEFDPTGHTRVPALTPQDIEEIHAVRLIIDPVATGLAAERCRPVDLAALEANVEATKSAKTLAMVSRLDTEFHDKIVRAAGNRRLLLCWNVLRDQFALWLSQMQLLHESATHRTRQQTVAAHQRLIDVIRSGDAKQASEEARRHVADWNKLMPKPPQAP